MKITFAVCFLLALLHNSCHAVSFHKYITIAEPNYFSGTNSRVQMSATAGAHEVIREITLYINGEPTDSKQINMDYPAFGLPANLGTTVMFDSSHFPNGSTVTCKLKATVDLLIWDPFEIGWMPIGQQTYDSVTQGIVITKTAKNKQVTFSHQDMGVVWGGSATGLYASSNYNTLDLYGSWTYDTFVSLMAGSNVVYVHAHAKAPFPSAFEDTVEPSTDAIPIEPFNIQVWRDQHNGSGYPFNNSTLNPPVNLALLLSCNVARNATGSGPPNNQYSTFLRPYFNNYGGWCENQAYAGCSEYVRIDEDGIFIVWWNAFLTLGYCVEETRAALIDLATSGEDFLEHMFTLNEGGAIWQYTPISEERLPIFGDHDASVKGVYQGPKAFVYAGPVLAWWKRLQ
jgi:hypothetical protein